MDTKRAELLLTELRDYLRKLNDEDLYIQTRNVSEAVQYLEQSDTEEEKEQIIRTYFRYLYPARGGLSDVVIWDSDFATRVALNEPLERIRKELTAIVRTRE